VIVYSLGSLSLPAQGRHFGVPRLIAAWARL
jgi:hypothetical protein